MTLPASRFGAGGLTKEDYGISLVQLKTLPELNSALHFAPTDNDTDSPYDPDIVMLPLLLIWASFRP